MYINTNKDYLYSLHLNCIKYICSFLITICFLMSSGWFSNKERSSMGYKQFNN